jgi:sulfonate transport system ATP-binding protein
MSVARAWPATLSGGEAARVALARALVRRPDLLLLDEPFDSLDALTRMRMHDLLAAMCRKYRPTVLFVTHDVEEALVLADRVVVMEEGVLGHEVPVNLSQPRVRTSEGFQALRSSLLALLGVGGEDSPGF